MNNAMLRGCAVLVCVLSVLGGSAGAGVVGVDAAGAVYAGAGVLDTASRTWSGTSFTLEGNTVTVDYDSAAMVADRSAYGGAPTLFQQMRYKGDGSETFDVTLSNLNTAFTYDLVVYGVDRWTGAGPRGSKYEVLGSGLGAKETTFLATSTSFTQDENYVRFDGLSAPTGTITLQVSEGTGGNTISMLNGFEIESVGGTPPPPPPVNSILQYGFDHTSGTVDGNGGSVINDAMPGTHDSVTIQAPGGTYSADIPTANVQNATGIGSLDVTGTAISTASSLGQGSGQGITTATDVFNAGGLTMEVWVKDMSLTTGGGPGLALNMGGMYVLGVAANGQIGFFHGDNSNDLSWTTAQDTSDWTHLAVVMETTDPDALSYDTITAYVNGSPIYSGSHTFPWFLDRAASVGNHQYDLGWGSLDGLVYEPRISLGALIPSQFTYGTASAPIPEPVTMAMLGLAVAGLGGYLRRRRNA